MTGYKTTIGFLKHLSQLVHDQDMSDCNDWDKLTDKEKEQFYGIIAGIQNDLSELSTSLNERGININAQK